MLETQVHSSQPKGGMRLEHDHGQLRNVIGVIRQEQACIKCIDRVRPLHAAGRTVRAANQPVTHAHPGSCLKKVAGLTGGARRFSSVQPICLKCL